MNGRKKYLIWFLILMLVVTSYPVTSAGIIGNKEEHIQSYSGISTSDTLSADTNQSEESSSEATAEEHPDTEKSSADTSETDQNTSDDRQNVSSAVLSEVSPSSVGQTDSSASTNTENTSTTGVSSTEAVNDTKSSTEGTVAQKETSNTENINKKKETQKAETYRLSGSISLTTDLGTKIGTYIVQVYAVDSYDASASDKENTKQALIATADAGEDAAFSIENLEEGSYRIEFISTNPDFDISLYQINDDCQYDIELEEEEKYFAVIESISFNEETNIAWALEDRLESGVIEGDFQNMTVRSLGGNYVKSSLDFAYNGTLSNRNFLYTSLMSKGIGLTAITSNLADDIARYYVIKQDNLDDAVSNNCYLKFSNAFFTSDVNGNTTYYDVKIYFWGESLGTTTNKPAVGFTTGGRFVYGCKCHFDGDSSLGNGTGRFVLKSQYRFYRAGDASEQEVYPSGVFYTGDNDADEGWCALNAGTLFTPFSSNTITTDTIQGNRYLVGTTDVTNQTAGDDDPSADIGCYFSTSASGGRLRLAYTANDGRSSPIKGFHYTLKYHVVGEYGTPANASAKPSDILVARYINTSAQKTTLFRAMTAEGYRFNGWYTSSTNLSGTKYSGETSTTSNINVYAEFIPTTGNLIVTKEIKGWTSTLSTDNRTFTFHLYGTSTIGKEVDQTETLEFAAATPISQTVTFSNIPVGTYTLTETYADQYWHSETSSKSITIEGDKTATVSFSNTLKIGHLNVYKTLEKVDPLTYMVSTETRYNSSLSGFAFHLYGTGDYGNEVDRFAVTDDVGHAAFTDVETGTYTLVEVSQEEVIAAAGNGNESALAIKDKVTQELLQYTTPVSQSITIVNDSSIDAAVRADQENILKKWRISLHKKDALLLEEGVAQYKATLAGAVYGLYDGENNLIATYETDEKGYFQTDYYICGDHWYIQEISPSIGYILDQTKYPIKAAIDDFQDGREYNEAVFDSSSQLGTDTNCVYEEPMLGKIIIKKTDENGKYLEGIEFSLTDKDGKVVDTITTNANGSAIFTDIVPAVYTIIETKTQKGYSLLAEAIEVEIPYVVNNKDAASYDNMVLNNALYDEEKETYLFYTLTYTIKDSATLDLPITGDSGMSLGWIVTGCIFLMFGVSIFLRKRHYG